MTARSSILDRVRRALATREVVAHPGSFEGWRPSTQPGNPTEQFREMFEKRAATICMFDISWTGGISEAKKISTMAESYNIPIATHDCVGPVTLAFSIHLSLNVPNTIIQETVRAFNNTWYQKIVNKLPKIENGYAYASNDFGCGVNLSNEFLSNKDTDKKVIAL